MLNSILSIFDTVYPFFALALTFRLRIYSHRFIFFSLSLFLDLVFIDTENNYSCKHKILRTHKMVQCLTQCTDSNIVNRELNRLIILKLNGYESCIVDRYALSRLHTSSYKYNTYLTLTSNRYTANAIENGTERERGGECAGNGGITL